MPTVGIWLQREPGTDKSQHRERIPLTVVCVDIFFAVLVFLQRVLSPDPAGPARHSRQRRMALGWIHFCVPGWLYHPATTTERMLQEQVYEYECIRTCLVRVKCSDVKFED